MRDEKNILLGLSTDGTIVAENRVIETHEKEEDINNNIWEVRDLVYYVVFAMNGRLSRL